METAVKKTQAKSKTKTVDARSRIKPRGLCGMFKDTLIVIGNDEDVFSLNRLEKAKAGNYNGE
jgi:hypothetical protein